MTLFCSEGVALFILMAGFLSRARWITSVNPINNDGRCAANLLYSSGMAPLVPSKAALSVKPEGCHLLSCAARLWEHTRKR